MLGALLTAWFLDTNLSALNATCGSTPAQACLPRERVALALATAER